MSDLEMSYLTPWQGTSIIAPALAAGRHAQLSGNWFYPVFLKNDLHQHMCKNDLYRVSMKYFKESVVSMKYCSCCVKTSYSYFRNPTKSSRENFIQCGNWALVFVSGRIRLSVSTVNSTYELSGITHVTPFHKNRKHSTGLSTYGPWFRTYSNLFSYKSVLTVCSYSAQSNEICTYGRVSRRSLPRVLRYGLLYLRTVEYDHCYCVSGIKIWKRISSLCGRRPPPVGLVMTL